VHDLNVGKVAVRLHAHVNCKLLDQVGQFGFVVYPYAIGISLAREFLRITAVRYVWYLRRGERYDFVVAIIPEQNVEVVESAGL
jgi:hypothetical protein